MLLLRVERISGQFWNYTYSVSPGTTVTITVPPAPGLPDPLDPVYAQIVTGLVRSGP